MNPNNKRDEDRMCLFEERKQYEKNRRHRGKYFFDGGYICCSTYGKPRSKNFHWKHYKQLLQGQDFLIFGGMI